MRLNFWITLFLSQWVYAEPTAIKIETLDTFNRTVQGVGVIEPYRCEEVPLWRQCFRSICPDGYGQLTKQFDVAKKKPVDGPIERKTKEEIKKAFRLGAQAQLAEYQRLLEFLKSGKEIDDPKAKVLVGVVRLVPLVPKVINNLMLIDTKIAREKFKDLSDSEFNSLITMAKLYIQASRETAELDFYKLRRSPDAIKRDIGKTLDRMKQLVMAFEKQYGVSSAYFLSVYQLGDEDRLRRGHLSEQNLDRLLSGYKFLQIFVSSIEDPDLIKKFSRESFKSNLDLKENIKELQTRIESIKDYLKNRDNSPKESLLSYTQNNVVDACMNNLKAMKHLALTKAEIDAFPVNLNDYKSDFLKALMPSLSEETAGRLSKEVKLWKPVMPPSYEQYRNQFLRQVQDYNLEYEVSIRNDEEFYKHHPQMYIAGLLAVKSKIEDDNVSKDLINLCDEHEPPLINDRTGFNGGIGISIFSARYNAIGRGVVNHEMAHLLGILFNDKKMSKKSTEWYQQVVQCLNQNKSESVDVSEDWADYIATLAGDPKSLCAALDDDESEMTLQSTDIHSTTLYRLLHKIKISGGLPPESCYSALALKGESMNLPNCYQEVKSVSSKH